MKGGVKGGGMMRVVAGKQAEALALMTERARFMARQPGFISVSLHRSLDGRRIVNYIQWKSRDLLESALVMDGHQ